jgi:hypothetical protein
MLCFSNIASALVALFIFSAAAAPQSEVEPGCFVSLVLFTSLEKPFTLSTLIPEQSTSTSQASIPVRITPFSPTEETPSRPIISRALIARTVFKLQDEKLIAQGFEVELLPLNTIFPSPLQGFVFDGKQATGPTNFTAGYACDNTDNVFLKLLIDQNKTIF